MMKISLVVLFMMVGMMSMLMVGWSVMARQRTGEMNFTEQLNSFVLSVVNPTRMVFVFTSREMNRSAKSENSRFIARLISTWRNCLKSTKLGSNVVVFQEP